MEATSASPDQARLTPGSIEAGVSLLRTQIQQAHVLLEETMIHALSEHSGGSASGWPYLLGRYTHAAVVEDATINVLLKGGAPLFATTWPDPRTDLAALRQYTQAVYAATDAYLASLSPDAVERTVDLSDVGMGRPAVQWLVNAFVVGGIVSLCGEIAAVTGLRPARGFGRWHSTPSATRRAGH